MNKLFVVCTLIIITASLPVGAGALDPQKLQGDLAKLVEHFDGRVGICVRDDVGAAEINGEQSFSLQSVMKLIVAMAVMDRIDTAGWHRDDAVVVRREDLSLFVQPLAKLVTPQGFHTDLGDLVRRAVVDSDSAASDILLERLGGPPRVRDFLGSRGVSGVRLDRDERHLQTEIVGLEWRPQFVDSEVLNRAIDAVPREVRDAAYKRYQADVRDSATPRGMASLLQLLASGKLLSEASTKFLLDVMSQTRTFPDRLKAGVPGDWTLGHKTGTSGSWNGVTAATNDVGILTWPDGKRCSVVVFIADSAAPEKKRAELMARIAKAVVSNFH